MARLLSPDEVARAGRFGFETDRTRFILSRGTLRTILARYLLADPSQLCFQLGAYGKPRLSGRFADAPIQFSLSRSRRFSLFGFARCQRIGVDLEEIRPIPDAEHVAALLFSLHENLAWSHLPGHLKKKAFFNGFVRKEACVKAMGKGFFQPPHQVEVSLVPEDPAQIVRINGSEEEGAQWSLQELDPIDGHASALVTECSQCRISCWSWQPIEMRGHVHLSSV